MWYTDVPDFILVNVLHPYIANMSCEELNVCRTSIRLYSLSLSHNADATADGSARLTQQIEYSATHAAIRPSTWKRITPADQVISSFNPHPYLANENRLATRYLDVALGEMFEHPVHPLVHCTSRYFVAKPPLWGAYTDAF